MIVKVKKAGTINWTAYYDVVLLDTYPVTGKPSWVTRCVLHTNYGGDVSTFVPPVGTVVSWFDPVESKKLTVTVVDVPE